MTSSQKLTIKVGFSEIKSEGHFRHSNLSKGQNLVNAGHIIDVEEVRETGKVTEIRGYCIPQTNIRNNPYPMELYLDDERNVIGGRCSCSGGATANCKHSAALFVYINSERIESQTDRQQEWNAPSKAAKKLYPKGETIAKLFNLESTPRLTFERDDESLSSFKEILLKHNATDGCLFNMLSSPSSEIGLVVDEDDPEFNEALAPIFSNPCRQFYFHGDDLDRWEDEISFFFVRWAGGYLGIFLQ